MIAYTFLGFQKYLDWLREACNVDIEFQGGETADLPDQTDTYIVDAVLVTRVELEKALSGDNIQPGDLIISLASGGKQAKYEKFRVNDIGSNGLTLARRALLSQDYNLKYPETLFAEIVDQIKESNLPDDLKGGEVSAAREIIRKHYGDNVFLERMIRTGRGYFGGYALDDKLSGAHMTAGEAITIPPRTYIPVTNALFDIFGEEGLKFIVQNSGGGQTKPIKFGSNLSYIKDNLLPTPSVFEEIMNSSGQPEKYMFSSFNMGGRLDVIVDPSAADEVVKFIKGNFGIDVKVTGRVEKAHKELPRTNRGNTMTIESEFGKFVYSDKATA